MSAFEVSKKHLDAIVTYGSLNNVYICDKADVLHVVGNEDQVGSILLSENTRSVNYRYGEHEAARDYQFARFPRPLSPVEVIKACDCLSYQSCETLDWESTKAFQIVTAIREKAIHNLAGYDKAAWEIR